MQTNGSDKEVIHVYNKQKNRGAIPADFLFDINVVGDEGFEPPTLSV